ncbi:SDR family NAD(P)-dependent oxidoreductase [Amycolatopsis sp. AA4]|uniref:SDR family NAD(P)-dependent oxidoreductase n=1 Tax=Amycolatopsis sp. AA4 TaxID=1896961 RepID=UPI0001B55FA7|nr:SDR family NAD(P)-dependent oxidoreductase [Amycolatopsis sp. AA4]
MGQLEGKTAVVTGGSSGIGLAAAERLVAEGAHVFITGRNRDALDAAAKNIGSVTAVADDIAAAQTIGSATAVTDDIPAAKTIRSPPR